MLDTVDAEIGAIAAIAKAMDPIRQDSDALKRVLGWANERYGGARFYPAVGGAPSPGAATDGYEGSVASSRLSQFADVAELFDAARPKTEWQKALVVGYWIMVGENQPDFASGDVNDRLKQLGHGIPNITDALTKAMRKKPALVIQTAKSGSARQARKKLKLTKAGMTAVEAMISGDSPSDD